MIMIFTLRMILTKVCEMELPYAVNSMLRYDTYLYAKGHKFQHLFKCSEGWRIIQELV